MQSTDKDFHNLEKILAYLADCVVGKFEQTPELPAENDEIAEINVGIELLAETIATAEKNISRVKERLYNLDQMIKTKKEEAALLDAAISKCYAKLDGFNNANGG